MRSFAFGILLYAFGANACALFADSQNRLFYDAVRAEASGDLDSAIEAYEGSAQVAHSANLHGNLANLYFKKEQFGRSILNYRKALILDPDHDDFSANLSFALEIAQVRSGDTDKPFVSFKASTLDLWTAALGVCFWSGLLLLSAFFFFRMDKVRTSIFLCLWLGILGFCSLGVIKAKEKHDLVGREVIVLGRISDLSDANRSKAISLRRFAGSTSSANTSVIPGESLFLDLDDKGTARAHLSPDGGKWYLARSSNGRKRGWIRANEVGRILETGKE